MSSLTRSALAASVLAAVRGKKKAGHLEGERPEDLEEEQDPDAEQDDVSPDANGDDVDPDAEGDDTDPDADGDDVDPDAEGDDAGEEKPTKEASARIRKAEQGRIHAILTHPIAQANHGLAMELAFGKTFYSAKSAGSLLNSSAGGASRLADRMAGKTPRLGSGTSSAQPTERQSVVAGVHKTIQAMHGRKPKGA